MLRAARVAVISIHALREEGDITALGLNTLGAIISIHALREEGDGLHSGGLLALLQFLSTPSARRATGNTAALSVTTIFLSTPSARRATRRTAHTEHSMDDFYPRPPRGGRRYHHGL